MSWPPKVNWKDAEDLKAYRCVECRYEWLMDTTPNACPSCAVAISNPLDLDVPYPVPLYGGQWGPVLDTLLDTAADHENCEEHSCDYDCDVAQLNESLRLARENLTGLENINNELRTQIHSLTTAVADWETRAKAAQSKLEVTIKQRDDAIDRFAKSQRTLEKIMNPPPPTTLTFTLPELDR